MYRVGDTMIYRHHNMSAAVYRHVYNPDYEQRLLEVGVSKDEILSVLRVDLDSDLGWFRKSQINHDPYWSLQPYTRCQAIVTP